MTMHVAPSGKVAYADVARGSKAEYTSRSFFPANAATARSGMFLATLSKRCAAQPGDEPHREGTRELKLFSPMVGEGRQMHFGIPNRSVRALVSSATCRTSTQRRPT